MGNKVNKFVDAALWLMFIGFVIAGLVETFSGH